MPRNGSGTYTLPAGNPVVTVTTISSTVQNNTTTDIATALTNSLAKDGQTTPTANLPMGTFRHTGVGNGVAATDYAALGQSQSSAYKLIGTVAGVDTITGVLTPTLTAYAAGQEFCFVSAGANTGAVTLNIDSLGAKSITKLGSTALIAGDIPSGALVKVCYDGTRFQLVGLAASFATNSTTQAALDNSTKIATTAYVDAASGLSKIFSISASVGASALTISAGALSLDFRSTTLGSGTVTSVSGTPANLVISSGSTLGTTSATQSDIAVLAINNAGTIELAAVNVDGGVDLSETGLVSTIAEGGAGGADSASVVYSTTARSNVAYRLIGIIRSTQATAGTWATAPSLIQGKGGQFFIPPRSTVRLNTANGYGSTNTAIRRFTNIVTNQGTDITYADSATNGASFTINTSGMYGISYTDVFTSISDLGLSLNSNQLNTSIASITVSAILSISSGAASGFATAGGTFYLPAGSIVRPHANGTSGTGSAFFTISRVS